MRITFPRPSNTRHTGTLQPITGRVTGPLYLFEDPLVPLEAANKRYVDLAFATLSASSVTSGTIPVERLPVFSGDVGVAPGTSVISLGNTGVTAGTYSKVTVDDKGRVLASQVFSINDIPDFGWNKIISGVPTTLSGYNITDALSINGGMITGSLSVQGAVTQNMHAATKGYVDTVSATGQSYVTGDIISQVTNTTPTGFLKLNGSALSKTTYVNLYAIIGDTFSNSGNEPGAGRPWEQQYEINTTQSANITGWTAGTSLPDTRSETQVVVTKNRVYVLGGGGTGLSNTIYYATINTDGTLGAWTLDSNTLPAVLYASQVIVVKNKVYLVGGRSVTGGTHYDVSTIYASTIDDNGAIGSWSTISTPPPNGDGKAFITKNRIYIVTYRTSNNSYNSSTFYIPINPDGTLGAWNSGPVFPVQVNGSSVMVTKNYVHVIGGRIQTMDFSTGTYLYNFRAPINSDGSLGAWVIVLNTLPVCLASATVMVTKNTAYIAGGYVFSAAGQNASSDVYRATINADGTLGTWSTGTQLPSGNYYLSGCMFNVNNKVYILGNQYGTVHYATISGGLNDYSPYYDGTLSPTDPAMFVIPNYASKETANRYYFIKY